MNHKSLLAAGLLSLALNGGAMAAANTVEPPETSVYAMATFAAADAVAAVESTSGGKVVELVLQDQGGAPAYQVAAVKSDGTELTYLVDGVSGEVTATDDVQDNGAKAESDGKESGESAGDADSTSEDAN
jgi:4-hydroxyphenylpyruvate dioxygenase-like putative hemolysin